MAEYPWASSIKKLRIILCLIGVLLSVYSYYDTADTQTKKNEFWDYSLLRSINSKLACPEVHSSRYATGFGFVETVLGKDSVFNTPNSLSGIVFYVSILLLGFFGSKTAAWLMVIGCLLSCLGCVYLAYVLYFLLNQSCLVSNFVYVISGSLLITNVYHLTQLVNSKQHGD